MRDGEDVLSALRILGLAEHVDQHILAVGFEFDVQVYRGLSGVQPRTSQLTGKVLYMFECMPGLEAR
jgi:hypothetical protein